VSSRSLWLSKSLMKNEEALAQPMTNINRLSNWLPKTNPVTQFYIHLEKLHAIACFNPNKSRGASPQTSGNEEDAVRPVGNLDRTY
jgi:hypothetical protein